MLSKCANPECRERFLYFGRGKIFHLSASPNVQALAAELGRSVKERFWLCDGCCRDLTMVWDGSKAKVIPLAKAVRDVGSAPVLVTPRLEIEFRRTLTRSRRQAVAVGREDR